MPPGPLLAPSPASATALKRRWLGHGLALAPVGADSLGHDLVLVGGRELALVEGEENLAQDLAVALLTPPGSDPLHVRFGFDGLHVLTQGLTPPLALEMLRLSVLRTVSADSRVAEVLDLTLEETGPGTRRWKVNVVVRTVVGGVVETVIGEVTADD
ncbi:MULTISPECIES: hypothetical protein [unclassified Streptomyces]|uniref:hypothetical protein n=1 Tax=unclassified Streptomyces TaxID=2593676 RepID=UPI00225557C9|nr:MULTISPECIES: hypothetical protein [unclassified Streptomyces]MCX4650253.1 hypothetical protein [Streptomyces sp. NBC_01446]MCX5327750.1 hypothetical protein [Streptomyces sp. NBC_00120]